MVAPLGALVAQLMASARANGDGGLDHSALLRGVERLSRLQPPSELAQLPFNDGELDIPPMRAADAAVKILASSKAPRRPSAFPGAAINPFYSAMRDHGGIKHVLARHVEGASHMAEGYTRAQGRQDRNLHRDFGTERAPT